MIVSLYFSAQTVCSVKAEMKLLDKTFSKHLLRLERLDDHCIYSPNQVKSKMQVLLCSLYRSRGYILLEVTLYTQPVTYTIIK